jgi:hypothetical protein
MNPEVATLREPFSASERIAKMNALLNGASFVDFRTPTSSIRISIVYPGNLDRIFHVTDTESGNVSILRTNVQGSVVEREELRRVQELVCGFPIYRFERADADPLSDIKFDRILASLNSTQKINLAA